MNFKIVKFSTTLFEPEAYIIVILDLILHISEVRLENVNT